MTAHPCTSPCLEPKKLRNVCTGIVAGREEVGNIIIEILLARARGSWGFPWWAGPEPHVENKTFLSSQIVVYP